MDTDEVRSVFGVRRSAFGVRRAGFSNICVNLCHLWIIVLLCGCGKPKPPALPPVPPPAAPAQQADAGPESEIAALFPLQSGGLWKMDATSDGQTYQFTLRVSEEKTNDAGKTVYYVVMQRDGEIVQHEGYTIDAEGIYRVAFGPNGAGKIDPPLPVVKTPLESGATWRWKGVFLSEDGSMPGEAMCSLSGPEPVTTTAGRFDAYRVDQQITVTQPDGSKYATTNTQWFASGVGPVKQITFDGEQRTTAELTDYRATPAGPQEGEEDSDDSTRE